MSAPDESERIQMLWRPLLHAAALILAASLRCPAVTAERVVHTWGRGFDNSILMHAQLQAVPGIKWLVASKGSFVAITTEGRLLTWGNNARIPARTAAALEAAPGIVQLVASRGG